jgi:hypothetical protein
MSSRRWLNWSVKRPIHLGIQTAALLDPTISAMATP